MFDYRYHALSLAAVLLALAVGVLLGVAIGDSNLVSSAKSGIVHDLRSEVSAAQQQAGQLKTSLQASENLNSALYPIAVHDTLAGRKIGLVFFGGSSNEIDELVREAVAAAGGRLSTVIAVREPLDLSGLAGDAAVTRDASANRYAALAAEPMSQATITLIREFGVRMGVQLVGVNNSASLLNRVHTTLLSAFDGEFGGLAGVVIVHDNPSGLTAEQSQVASEFESGLIAGVSGLGVSAVGVELTHTEPSQIPWYRSRNLSSVDDLDTLAGRTALAFALAGAQGTYGTKPSADALIPNVIGTSLTE